MEKRIKLFVFASYGIGFFLGFESGGFQLVLLQIARFYDLNNVEMGALVTAQLSAITVGPLLFGWVADRVGKKIILMISMPIFAFGCFGAALSTSAMIFASSVFVAGLGYSVSECISSSALSDSFPGQESRYLNMMQCVFCLGAVVSPQIFSRLISAGFVSWHAVFLISGLGFALVYPILCLSKCRQDTGLKLNSPTKGQLQIQREVKPSFRVFSPFMIVLVVTMVSYVAIEMGIAFFVDALFVTEYSNSELGAYAISGFWLAMTIFRFVFAFTNVKMRAMVLMGFSASCLIMVVLVLLRNQWFLLALFIMLGAVLAPVWPMIVGMGTSTYRERSGTVASILSAAGGLGGTIMPVLIGWVSERVGFYGGFWLFAAVSAVGFLVMWYGGKWQKVPGEFSAGP